jgi:hypothetical protein
VATDAAGDVVEAGPGVGLEHAAANGATAVATARIRPDVLAWSTTASCVEVDDDVGQRYIRRCYLSFSASAAAF